MRWKSIAPVQLGCGKWVRWWKFALFHFNGLIITSIFSLFGRMMPAKISQLQFNLIEHNMNAWVLVLIVSCKLADLSRSSLANLYSLPFLYVLIQLGMLHTTNIKRLVNMWIISCVFTHFFIGYRLQFVDSRSACIDRIAMHDYYALLYSHHHCPFLSIPTPLPTLITMCYIYRLAWDYNLF